MTLCLPFCWFWPGSWDFFFFFKKKKGQQNKGPLFWNRGFVHLLHTSIGVDQYMSCKACLPFLFPFWRQKEKPLKVLLTCTFMSWLLDSFYLLSFGSELRYMPRLLLMFLGEMGVLEAALNVGEWIAMGKGFVIDCVNLQFTNKRYQNSILGCLWSVLLVFFQKFIDNFLTKNDLKRFYCGLCSCAEAVSGEFFDVSYGVKASWEFRF